ncbi:hypothetical protein G647_08297 [Cladophialophora carrionii CBS 160.54]|uniref:Uncharacterized protein n=1 Tax=Cladophialophora carrionii CBS 160.54 TaxID=1279043 RepID=V9D1U0_9EURO|nr:uncharacterized protein G647_08297 [Cladophialophora carrionii CBS 160.54]ETI20263.1 hypothetical protein G647_08297 [Cladophialophora carrionii CBS 160.54]
MAIFLTKAMKRPLRLWPPCCEVRTFLTCGLLARVPLLHQ